MPRIQYNPDTGWDTEDVTVAADFDYVITNLTNSPAKVSFDHSNSGAGSIAGHANDQRITLEPNETVIYHNTRSGNLKVSAATVHTSVGSQTYPDEHFDDVGTFLGTFDPGAANRNVGIYIQQLTI